MEFSEWARARFISPKSLFSYMMVEAAWDAASEQSSAEIERLRAALEDCASALLVALNPPCGYPECLDEDERCERWLSGECVGPTAKGE